MRKRAYLSGAAFCAAVAAGLLLGGADAANAGRPGAGAAARLARQLGPGVEVAAHRQTGAVRFVGTAPGRPIPRPPGVAPSAPAATAARAFVEQHGRAFGLREGAGLRVERAAKGAAGVTAVRFGQAVGGVPVLAGELVVDVDPRGEVLSALGELEPDPVDTTAAIGAAQARRIALAATARSLGRSAAALDAGEPSLAIYDPRLLGGPGLERPALVWQTEVSSAGGATRRLVLVDAGLGVVAASVDLVEQARDRRVCDAGNTDGSAGHRYPCLAPYERQEGQAATGDADIDLAYDYAGDTYDFYSSHFGRDSLDGAGLPLISTVRYCEPGEACPYENAFWDGSQMAYGEGFAAADDVVGHELTHGFTQFTSNLFYWYQSGAINESMSDVFGEFIDLSNGSGSDQAADRWLIGEDIPKIGAIRSMKNPPAFGDPDKMTSSRYVADPNQSDSGGVHTNSGVNNKAAYLIADGDSFNGRTVTGIGLSKAARVYHDAETTQLTSGSDYEDLYYALQQSCTNAIGGGEGISGADCQEVTDAVEATEMNLQPLNGPAPEAPVCGSGEEPEDLFSDDLENTASGNWAHTALSGSDGWYYPQNPNPYDEWFDATYATSGTTNFWGDDPATTADFAISQTSGVSIPAGSVYLRFDHSYAFEDSSVPQRRYDGGRLEYSADGGAWQDAGPLFTHNGYNGTIETKYGNPLGGKEAFTAESNGYISSRVDLSSLAGHSVRIRFRIGTDNVGGDYGWFIDDVRVYRCVEGTPPPDETPPAPPTLTATEPASPANDNAPKVRGSAEAGSTVYLYKAATTGDCTVANLAAEGSASQFAGPGLSVSVANDSTTAFRAKAEDAAGNLSGCSSSSIQYVEDSTPPSNPSLSSPSHTVGVASNDPTVEVAFTGAADSLSGLDGYSYVWDTSPGTTPDTTKDAEQTATSTTSPALPDGSSHYFHLRTRDNAGNWSAAVHFGPFAIDTTAPISPTPTTTEPASPANDNGPKVKGGAEAGSTVYLFKAATTGDCTAANLAAEGSASTFASPGLGVSVADDSTTTFRAKAKDAAGNLSGCSSSSIQYVEDSTAPQTTITGPTGTTSDPTPEFSFSSSESGSSFECRIDSAAFSSCTSPYVASLLTDGNHSFEVKATDLAGNTDTTPARREFTVDTSFPPEPEPEPEPGPEPGPEPSPEPEAQPAPEPDSPLPAPLSPSPVFPSAPADETAPVLRLGATSQTQPVGGTVSLEVSCDEDCRVVAWGRVAVWRAGNGGAGARSARLRALKVGLRKVGRQLASGQAATLRLRPKTPEAARRLLRLLRRGWRARAVVDLRSVDRSGNATKKRVVVALRSRQR